MKLFDKDHIDVKISRFIQNIWCFLPRKATVSPRWLQSRAALVPASVYLLVRHSFWFVSEPASPTPSLATPHHIISLFLSF